MSEQSKAPDHRPYLVDGDLRTPEDVLAWVSEYIEAWQREAKEDPSIGAQHFRLDFAGMRTLQQLHVDLQHRLDREKRIACRRAVSALLGPACERLRAIKRNLRTAKFKSSPKWIDAYRNEWVNWEQTAERLKEERMTLVRLVLAFRKEARKP
jgi:hypothetical protein